MNPVVGVLLLIAVSVSIISIVYISLSSLIPLVIPREENQGYEKITIDSATLYSNGTFIIIIRNIGEVPLVIDTIYLIDDLTDSLIAHVDTFTINGLQYDKYKLNVYDVIEIHGNFNVLLTSRKTYCIKVTTTTGKYAIIKTRAI